MMLGHAKYRHDKGFKTIRPGLIDESHSLYHMD